MTATGAALPGVSVRAHGRHPRGFSQQTTGSRPKRSTTKRLTAALALGGAGPGRGPPGASPARRRPGNVGPGWAGSVGRGLGLAKTAVSLISDFGFRIWDCPTAKLPERRYRQ